MKIFRLFLLIVLILFLKSCIYLQAQTVINQPTIIKIVSVQNRQDSVRIDWIPITSLQVSKYEILVRDPNTPDAWLHLVFTQSGNDSAYIFKYSPVQTGPVSFNMRFFDNQDNHSVQGNVHTLNFLQIDPDTCNYSFHLKWSGYKLSDTPPGLQLNRYEELLKEGSKPEYVDTTVMPGILNLDFPQPHSDSIYSFTIKTIKNDSLISYSNRVSVVMRIPKIPSFISADNATINSNGKIGLSFSLDTTSTIKNYVLYRADAETGPFSQINSYTNLRSSFLIYEDPQADPSVRHYYRLVVQNSCNLSLKTSNLAGNIVLHTHETGSEVSLDWNKYRWWQGGAGTDSLLRSTPSGGWEFVASISPSDSTYIDKIDSLANRNYHDKICYRIKSSQPGINPYGTSFQNFSNLSCVDLPPAVRVPNAFTPNGDLVNDEFTIYFDFIPEQYLLKIFDRNANILFQTTDPLSFWNGTDSRGQKVRQGTYVYYLQYSFQGQSSREIKGTVSVIYP